MDCPLGAGFDGLWEFHKARETLLRPNIKQVFIIAYHFPPENTIAALRPGGLAKYLPQFGWEPVVLTARLPGQSRDDLRKKMALVEVEPFDIYSYFKKYTGIGHESKPLSLSGRNRREDTRAERFVKKQFKTIMAFPDRRNGWYRSAAKAADIIVKEQKIDCILSISTPWPPALIARRLKEKYGIPWVVSAGDLWTQYHRYDFCFMRKRLEILLEKWTLKTTDSMIMVSEERATEWRKLHGNKSIVPITCGFDPDDFQNGSISQPTHRFLITHAGKIMGKQSPEPLFRALSELILEGYLATEMIDVRFWGPVPNWVVRRARDYGLDNVVKFYDTIPRAEVIEKEMESHLLLLLTWNDVAEPGIHPGKLFDYLGARRPILAIGTHRDVVTKVLRETKAGIHCTKFEELKEYVQKAYCSFKEKGTVPYYGIDAEIEKYSYKNITARYSEVLNDVVNKTSCQCQTPI